MYGPPLFRKQKMRMTGWSALMYTALVGVPRSWARMECAALCSYLNVQPCQEFYTKQVFQKRRVGPLCHLTVRQQTLAENHKLRSRHWSVDVGIASAISKPGFTGVICRPVKLLLHWPVSKAGMAHRWRGRPRPCGPACWPAPRSQCWDGCAR